MPDLNKFSPINESFFDINDIVDNSTASEIGSKLLQIEADIKASNPVVGDIKFSMSPNSLCATWNYLKEISAETVGLDKESYEDRISRRRLAHMHKQLKKLSSAEKALGLTPRSLTSLSLN